MTITGDRKSTRLNSTLSLHDALPIYEQQQVIRVDRLGEKIEGPLLHRRDRIFDAAVGRHDDHRRSEEHTSELHSFPTRRSSDLRAAAGDQGRPAWRENRGPLPSSP